MLLANTALDWWTRILPQVEAAMARGHDALYVPALFPIVDWLVWPPANTSMPKAVQAKVNRNGADSFERLVCTTWLFHG